MNRTSKTLLLALFGLAVYVAAESFQPAERQLSAKACLLAIDGYQAAGSPLLRAAGVRCRYTPSCSAYAEEAIGHYGTVTGTLKTCARLWRCSPWGGCGYDPAVAKAVLFPLAQESPEDKRRREEMEKAAREIEKSFQQFGKEAEEGAFFCGVGILGCVVVWVVALVVSILIMVWVYKDAKSRGDQNAVIWLVLIFFTGIIGLIIYVLARPKGDLAPCPNCRNKRMVSLNKCPHCGTEGGPAGKAPVA